MRVYYFQDEYVPGKHHIAKVWSAKFLQARPEENINTAINVPYSVLEIDDEWNRDLISQVIDYRRETRSGLLPDKFYIDNAVPPQIHLTDTGVVVPILANPNKADWVASVLAGATDAQVDQWFTNNFPSLNAAERLRLSMMAKLIARLARQAGFE